MKVLDIHTHFMPAALPRWAEKFGGGDFIRLEHDGCGGTLMLKPDGSLFRKVEPNCLDLEARLRDCDRVGASVQVLSTVPVLFAYHARPRDGLEVAQFLNDHLAETRAKHPDRFEFVGTLPMQSPELACQEIARAMGDLGARGFQIGSNIQGINLSDARFECVWQTLAEHDACVFVHPWDMMGESAMPKYWLPWLVGMPAESSRAICSLIFGGVFERHPGIRFAFAHGGGSFAGTFGRIEHGFHCRPDLVAVDNAREPREYLGKFWVDSLTHDPRALAFILETFGEDRVAFGSDTPFPLGELDPRAWAEKNRGVGALGKIAWDNGWAWLGGESEHV